MNALTLDRVCKSYGSKSVLKGVSGSIESGRAVGLLGRNGEGKTTLFRILLDIVAADSGTFSVLGRSPDASGKIRLHTGYVPERPTFHEFFNVEEVLRMRRNIFANWDRNKEKELIARLKLDPNTPIKGASKGTLANLAWVCAVAHNPSLLLLDEPTSGLDALVREHVLTQMVGELSAENKTIFVASHHLEEMANVLDEVWVLSDGTITQRYTLDKLREEGQRLTGKLRMEPPENLRVFEEHRSGNVVRWAVMDHETMDEIRSRSLLDFMESEPLPIDAAFKMMLAEKEDNHVR